MGKCVVSVPLADGKVHQFDVDPVCATGQYPSVFPLTFTPRAGTTSPLAPLDAVDCCTRKARCSIRTRRRDPLAIPGEIRDWVEYWGIPHFEAV